MMLLSLLAGLCLAGCTNVAQMQQKYEAGDHRQLDNLVEIVARPDYPYATRKNAARALGQIGDRKAVPVLIGVLGEYDQRTTLKVEALKSLGAIGDPSAVESIGRLLDRSLEQADADLRLAALPVLGQLGGAPAAAILLRALRYYDLLKMRDEYNQRRGVFSGEEQRLLFEADSLAAGRRGGPVMGMFGEDQMPTTSMFGTDMNLGTLQMPDPTPEERAQARAALLQVGPPAAPAIVECLATQEISPGLRQDLEALLAQLQPADPAPAQTGPDSAPR
ncbi:MAG: HEAT repeat domain-containing protein [Candidatus Latescibacteria bacterium]|nr:HEAT repeat domain-containing protein [Candidatus Latescibacterota bacterium]